MKYTKYLLVYIVVVLAVIAGNELTTEIDSYLYCHTHKNSNWYCTYDK